MYQITFLFTWNLTSSRVFEGLTAFQMGHSRSFWVDIGRWIYPVETIVSNKNMEICKGPRQKFRWSSHPHFLASILTNFSSTSQQSLRWKKKTPCPPMLLGKTWCILLIQKRRLICFRYLSISFPVLAVMFRLCRCQGLIKKLQLDSLLMQKRWKISGEPPGIYKTPCK